MRRTENYLVTHNPGFHNFLISPKLIMSENALRFVYRKGGFDIEKIIPLSYIGPHLKFRAMNKWDEQLMKYERRGFVYYIDENVVFDYGK